MYCDTSGDNLRTFIHISFREKIIESFHSLSHPSARVLDRIIRKRYIWPGMHKQISQFFKAYASCQKSKVRRHNILLPAEFFASETRFEHIHMDIVGPLPIDNEFRYCLTMIDRFSR